MRDFEINQRSIGPGHPTYVIAEMSANHGHDLIKARELVYAAKAAGADAIKLQTYTPDTMTLDCDQPHFQIGPGSIWEGRKLYELYGEAHTPWEWHAELFQLAHEIELDCFSSPFDRTAVDFLETLNAPCYKVASFELVDLPLIQYIAAQGKPIIISTGMGSKSEIAEAVAEVQKFDVPLCLLKCTSAYPAPPESMNLVTIPDLANRFKVISGLSDHTLGIEVAVAAVALGACIIEKHFTLDRSEPGPDSSFSLEPDEFTQLVNSVRQTELAMGQVSYQRSEKEQASLEFRRSLFAVDDIEAGELFTQDNVRAIRPGKGLPPKYIQNILGTPATCQLKKGTPLDWVHLTSEASQEAKSKG